ncbi:DNA phosphorothioation-dependent restriction protein DptG [Oceanobacillus salinisoli]|uniref:DNA phosphorothioation-dependent restriction protein DptG n=1 Tax=Oceanobacillus salinisoli TaxID=2678611 RepID=UPI0012E0E7E5|nr:DNA phosphorothioation-dependent restriction protein DptG [Oceanobacillus salinisoli]
MSYTEHLNELRKSLSIKKDKQGLKHTINKKSPILPFPTRNPERAKFAQGFNGVTGEFARTISDNKINADVTMDSVIEKITNKVNPKEEDMPYFVRLVHMFLSDDLKSMKVFHPHIFQYTPMTSGKEAKGEANIALFIRDVLLGKDDNVRNFFAKTEADHLVAKLILDQLDHLENSERENRYHNLIPMISDVFKEDLLYLMNHREYFIENIHLFLAYYYFFYITQVTLKLNQFQKGTWDTINEVVYTLDWEASSKSRIGYERGYQRIKESGRHLLVHVNCLEHLNFLFGTTHASGYSDLKQQYEKLTVEEQRDLVQVLRKWIEEYRYHTSLPELDLNDNSYDNLVMKLYQSINEGITLETKSRYSLSIEEIGKRYFLKTRGVLGYMLNISQDFLLLLTTISVKDKRKSLKDVFKEFERRGIFFDRHSQEAVVQLYDKLNILDKKSDSGDAQYVKPIL